MKPCSCSALLPWLWLNLLHSEVTAHLSTTLSRTLHFLLSFMKTPSSSSQCLWNVPLLLYPSSPLKKRKKKRKAHLALRAPPGPPLGTPPRRELGLPKCFCSCSLCLSEGVGGRREGEGISTQAALYWHNWKHKHEKLTRTEERQRVDMNCGWREREKPHYIIHAVPMAFYSLYQYCCFSQLVTMTTNLSPSQLTGELVSQIWRFNKCSKAYLLLATLTVSELISRQSARQSITWKQLIRNSCPHPPHPSSSLVLPFLRWLSSLFQRLSPLLCARVGSTPHIYHHYCVHFDSLLPLITTTRMGRSLIQSQCSDPQWLVWWGAFSGGPRMNLWF